MDCDFQGHSVDIVTYSNLGCSCYLGTDLPIIYLKETTPCACLENISSRKGIRDGEVFSQHAVGNVVFMILATA